MDMEGAAAFDYEDNAGCADEFREGEDACDDYVDGLYTKELSSSPSSKLGRNGGFYYFRQLQGNFQLPPTTCQRTRLISEFY